VAYYTAILARSGERWQLRPSDIDSPEDLADVTDAVRQAGRGGGGLALVEREDEWFAIVRVDEEEDPRIFVSDLGAARKGPFGVLFEDVEEWDRPITAAPAGVGAGDAVASGDAVAARTATGTSDDGRDDGAVTRPASGGPGLVEVDDADDDEDDDEDDEDDDARLSEEDLDDEDAPDDSENTVDIESGGASSGDGSRSSHDRDQAGLGSPAVDSGVALAPAPPEDMAWAGDLALLEDYGLSPDMLRAIVEAEGSDPSAALLAIGEHAGFADLVDEWH